MKTGRTYQREKVHANRDDDHPGYPEYTPDEDIYNSGREEDEIDPENTHRRKSSVIADDLEDDESGDNLDIPGSELDDDMEETGNEDEENNYYSLSDDRKDDLEDLL